MYISIILHALCSAHRNTGMCSVPIRPACECAQCSSCMAVFDAGFKNSDVISLCSMILCPEHDDLMHNHPSINKNTSILVSTELGIYGMIMYWWYVLVCFIVAPRYGRIRRRCIQGLSMRHLQQSWLLQLVLLPMSFLPNWGPLIHKICDDVFHEVKFVVLYVSMLMAVCLSHSFSFI